MNETERRALVRAGMILLCVSAARWGWDRRSPPGPPVAAESVLAELTAAAEEAVSEEEARGRPLQPGERIDPNRAEEVELDRLHGVGPSTARAIVRAREEGAIFASPEDLEVVRGIGPALSARLAPHLDFRAAPRRTATGGPGPRHALVDLNRADADELAGLPGIGPALAARIVARRRERPFATVEEVLDVRGIGPATLERLRALVTVGGRR